MIIDQTKQDFLETRQVVLSIKEEIYPLQQIEGNHIKQVQRDFTQTLRDFFQEFMDTMPFDFPDDTKIEHVQAAYRKIDQYKLKLKQFEKDARKLRKDLDLFGIERMKNIEIRKCRKNLRNLKLFYDSVGLVTYNYEKWKQQPWQ